VSVYRIPIFFVRWSPPVQSPAEETAFGAEIDRRGSLHYLGHFISQREPFFAGIRFGWIALAVAILTLICIFFPPLVVLFVGVLIINLFLYWTTFFVALARYAAWLRRCRRSYVSHKPIEAEVEVVPSHVVISCPSCVQKLRVPTDRAQARAKCPSCGHVFVFNRAQYYEQT